MRSIVSVSVSLLFLTINSAAFVRFNAPPARTHFSPEVTKSQFRLSAFPLVQPSDHGGEIETKYDGFSSETVVKLKKMRVTCQTAKGLASTVKRTCVSIVASLHCPGLQLSRVRYAKLQLIFESKDWDSRHPLNQRDLVAVADGDTLRMGRMQLANQGLDTDRGIDVMKEVLEVSIPYQAFERLARAEFVEMKVGETSFTLRDKNLWALRDVKNRILK